MRMRIVFTVIFCVWVLLIARVYHLSINSNAYYEEIAEQNAIKSQFIAPTRGLVLDVKNRPMAVNRLGFAVAIKPHLSKSKQLDIELENLHSILGDDINVTKMKKEYLKADSPYNQEFIDVIDFMDYDIMMPKFSALSLHENLLIHPATKRHYPYNSLASHVIGYVGRANQNDVDSNIVAKLTNHVGRSGIENYYNEILQGKEGVRKIKVNALNQQVEQVLMIPPKSKDIRLSLDIELQQFIEEIFADDAGAVIVMNAKTGAIVAAGSFPEYDLNPFVLGISQENWNKLVNSIDHPFTNKLVNGLYPPGSVVKMGVALSFLDSGKMDRNDGFYCTGSFELGGRNFRCWNDRGHGFVNLETAIMQSCDDYFYKGSQKVGIDAITPVLEKIGFGQKSGIDLPNEFVGVAPGRSWKMQKYSQPWYQGETLITSIGQGNFLVTPTQIAKYTAMLATGKSPTPHFLHSIDNELVVFEPVEIFNEFEKKQLPYIQKAMYDVANSQRGTASRHFATTKVNVATKTGTAQVVGISQTEKKRMKEEDMKYLQRSHAWITAYAPYEDPEFVVSIIVEHGGHGGAAAGPKASKIFDKLLEMGYIDAKFQKR
ncbi:MAG: penicillin-binding protein 2 [Campylobacter sp.]